MTSSAPRTPPSSPDLRDTLSGSLAANLIHNEELDPEQQPLRRSNTTTANRERFQQNQRTAAQGVVQRNLQRSGWVLLVALILLSMLVFIWVVFYFQGWTVWREHRTKPCDQPLADWLLIMLMLPLVALVVECLTCKNLRFPVIFLTLCALLIGLRMFTKAKTCEKTNPELYEFVRLYLMFLSVWWVLWVVMPTIFFILVIYGMWHGWFDQLNGASPDTIKNIETVDYDASLFATPGGTGDTTTMPTDDGKPAPECCICTETFDPAKEIKRTACQHYFHEECLGTWLKVSTSCPLCRNDLEKATLGENAPSSSQQPAFGGQTLWAAHNLDVPPEAPASAQEAEQVQILLGLCPDIGDERDALDAVRQFGNGSAEQAASILREV